MGRILLRSQWQETRLVFKVTVSILSRNTDLIHRVEGLMVDNQASAVVIPRKDFQSNFHNLCVVPGNRVPTRSLKKVSPVEN